MVRHIILWNVREGLKKEEQSIIIRQKANELLAGIGGVLRLDVGYGYKEGNHDLVLYIEFTDARAEEAYHTHPNHIAFKDFIKDIVCDRISMDEETD